MIDENYQYAGDSVRLIRVTFSFVSRYFNYNHLNDYKFRILLAKISMNHIFQPYFTQPSIYANGLIGGRSLGLIFQVDNDKILRTILFNHLIICQYY